MTLAEVNDLDRDGFTTVLGHLFEHSPWVAAEAWRYRPFASAAELTRAMQEVLRHAGAEAQLALIRAHPDLAGKVALTHASAREQASVRLDQLSAEEYQRFHRLNAAYLAKFAFPFVICVRRHDKHSILAEFERRLARDEDAERDQALHEIGEIVRLRLADLIEDA